MNQERIDTRTAVWGILQRSPRQSNAHIARILRVTPNTVRIYRKEYREELKAGGKGSPEPIPEDLEDWTDLQESQDSS